MIKKVLVIVGFNNGNEVVWILVKHCNTFLFFPNNSDLLIDKKNLYD